MLELHRGWSPERIAGHLQCSAHTPAIWFRPGGRVRGPIWRRGERLKANSGNAAGAQSKADGAGRCGAFAGNCARASARRCASGARIPDADRLACGGCRSRWFVATLGYSRRDARAFARVAAVVVRGHGGGVDFGGVPATVLMDNATLVGGEELRAAGLPQGEGRAELRGAIGGPHSAGGARRRVIADRPVRHGADGAGAAGGRSFGSPVELARSPRLRGGARHEAVLGALAAGGRAGAACASTTARRLRRNQRIVDPGHFKGIRHPASAGRRGVLGRVRRAELCAFWAACWTRRRAGNCAAGGRCAAVRTRAVGQGLPHPAQPRPGALPVGARAADFDHDAQPGVDAGQVRELQVPLGARRAADRPARRGQGDRPGPGGGAPGLHGGSSPPTRNWCGPTTRASSRNAAMLAGPGCWRLDAGQRLQLAAGSSAAAFQQPVASGGPCSATTWRPRRFSTGCCITARC